MSITATTYWEIDSILITHTDKKKNETYLDLNIDEARNLLAQLQNAITQYNQTETEAQKYFRTHK